MHFAYFLHLIIYIYTFCQYASSYSLILSKSVLKEFIPFKLSATFIIYNSVSLLGFHLCCQAHKKKLLQAKLGKELLLLVYYTAKIIKLVTIITTPTTRLSVFPLARLAITAAILAQSQVKTTHRIRQDTSGIPPIAK